MSFADALVEIACDTPCRLGENPLWHAADKRLYWTDIDGGKLFRYDPRTRGTECCYEGPRVGGFTIEEDGSLLLFRDRGNIVLWRDGAVRDTVLDSLPEVVERGGRFNDVIADPEGRVFCGTLNEKGAGALYRLDRDRSLTKLVDGVGISNGLAFDRDLKKVFYTDSRAQRIDAFDYERRTGALSGRRTWLDLADKTGVPDGMTIDSRDVVWSARWDGSGVFAYDAGGAELGSVTVAAAKCSSVAFGGDDLEIMFLTSAGGHERAGPTDHAGALFTVRGVGPGRPEFRSRIGRGAAR